MPIKSKGIVLSQTASNAAPKKAHLTDMDSALRVMITSSVKCVVIDYSVAFYYFNFYLFIDILYNY